MKYVTNVFIMSILMMSFIGATSAFSQTKTVKKSKAKTSKVISKTKKKSDKKVDKAKKAKASKKVAVGKSKTKKSKAALKAESKEAKSKVSAKDAAANAKLKSNKKPIKGVANKKLCQAKTKEGSQCKRTAQSSSKFCWQHDKK